MATFTRSTVATNNISVLADEPVITPTNLKKAFDQYGIDDKVFTNDTLIAELESTTSGSSGAEKIGSATIAGVTGNLVHDQLESLYALIQGAVAGSIPNGTLEETKQADIYRDVDFTYTGGGFVDTATYKLGGVTKKTVAFTYTGTNVNTITVSIVGGDTITTTLTYNGSNQITNITKVVS